MEKSCQNVNTNFHSGEFTEDESLSKVKVLHIIDTLNVGGAERVAVTLANLFASKNHKVGILILLDGTNTLKSQLSSNVKVYYLHRKNKFNFLKGKKVLDICKCFDIIHVHLRQNIRYLWYINLFYSISNSDIFFHDHYGAIKTDKSIDLITRLAIKNRTYIGVSDELCNWRKNVDKVRIEKINLLSNIIVRSLSLRIDNNNTGNSATRLVLTANIYPRKNIEFALRILESMICQRETTLDILGTIVDKEYYERIDNLLKRYGLSDSVCFIHNCVDIQSVLHNYDLALHTAISETGPLVLMEYMAQSLPFVTYHTGEVVEQINSELPEFVMDSFCVSEWVLRINHILANNKEYLKNKLTTFFNKNYSSEEYYQKCLKIYQKN